MWGDPLSIKRRSRWDRKEFLKKRLFLRFMRYFEIYIRQQHKNNSVKIQSVLLPLRQLKQVPI